VAPTDLDRQPFVNRLTGTFTATSTEWFLSADQWSQTYYQLREGKLYLCWNDNKEQTYEEQEIDVPEFLRKNASASEAPYPEIVATVRELAGGG
jgi:hypothetical protein